MMPLNKAAGVEEAHPARRRPMANHLARELNKESIGCLWALQSFVEEGEHAFEVFS